MAEHFIFPFIANIDFTRKNKAPKEFPRGLVVPPETQLINNSIVFTDLHDVDKVNYTYIMSTFFQFLKQPL